MTSPIRIALALRFVAEKIDGSAHPSKSAVLADLRLIKLAASGLDSDEIKFSEEGLSKILWGKPEGKAVDFDWKRAKELTDDDKLIFQLQKLQKDINGFIKAIRGEESETQSQSDEDVVTSLPPKSKT